MTAFTYDFPLYNEIEDRLAKLEERIREKRTLPENVRERINAISEKSMSAHKLSIGNMSIRSLYLIVVDNNKQEYGIPEYPCISIPTHFEQLTLQYLSKHSFRLSAKLAAFSDAFEMPSKIEEKYGMPQLIPSCIDRKHNDSFYNKVDNLDRSVILFETSVNFSNHDKLAALITYEAPQGMLSYQRLL